MTSSAAAGVFSSLIGDGWVAGSLNTFGRNEIEVAPISSALLRIACLVILYKTCRVPDQELAADGVSGPVWGLALNYK